MPSASHAVTPIVRASGLYHGRSSSQTRVGERSCAQTPMACVLLNGSQHPSDPPFRRIPLSVLGTRCAERSLRLSRVRRFRAPFVVTLASVSTLAACGGSTSSDGSGGSGGGGNVSGSGGSGNVSGFGGSGNVGGSGGNPGGCPTTFPQNDTSCSLPSGTKCNFPQGSCCPPWEAICSGGKWQAFASSCNPPPPEACPETPPTAGTACGSTDPCGNTYQYCTYGKCMDGSPQTVAECQNGTWQVAVSKCAVPPCESLSPCDCFDRTDCQAVADGCLCECDYNCPGKPPCACACGGGKFLGCKPLTN